MISQAILLGSLPKERSQTKGLNRSQDSGEELLPNVYLSVVRMSSCIKINNLAAGPNIVNDGNR